MHSVTQTNKGDGHRATTNKEYAMASRVTGRYARHDQCRR